MKNGKSPHPGARRASIWLGVSARTLHRERGAGSGHYEFGHRFLYRMEDLECRAADRHVPAGSRGGRRAA